MDEADLLSLILSVGPGTVQYSSAKYSCSTTTILWPPIDRTCKPGLRQSADPRIPQLDHAVKSQLAWDGSPYLRWVHWGCPNFVRSRSAAHSFSSSVKEPLCHKTFRARPRDFTHTSSHA